MPLYLSTYVWTLRARGTICGHGSWAGSVWLEF